MTKLNAVVGQERAGQMLLSAYAGGHLAHAYILLGSAIAGGRELVLALAQAIACPETGPLGGCGECKTCSQITRGTFPDYVELVAKGQEIKVVQVRDLIDWISLSPYKSPLKLAVIVDGDRLNDESSNCLLKTLEEPPSKSMLIILAENLRNLLPTIVSRCQIIRLAPPAAERLLPIFLSAGLSEEHANTLARRSRTSEDPKSSWETLEAARGIARQLLAVMWAKPGGSPLEIVDKLKMLKKKKVEEKEENPEETGGIGKATSEKLSRDDLREILSEMGWWLRDLCWLSNGGNPTEVSNPDALLELHTDLTATQGHDLLHAWETVTKAERKTDHNAHVKLTLDELLMRLREC